MKTETLIKFGRAATAALALLALATPVCHGDELTTNSLVLPAGIHAKVSSSGCDNSEGPRITLSGSIDVSAFKTKFTFKNNKRGHRTTNCVTECEAVLIP